MHINGFSQLGKLLALVFRGESPKVEVEFDDAPVEHVLCLRRVVCPTCNGRGRHVNPSIDAHGISSSEFDEDPQFEEEYKSGAYDVSCYECGGRGTSLCIDEKRTKFSALAAAISCIEDHEAFVRESEAERRMGA